MNRNKYYPDEKALALVRECRVTLARELNLENLDLIDNYFTPNNKLYHELIRCTHITHLNLSRNNLQQIPDISQLVSLIELNLNNNHIKKITGLDTFGNLKTLSLSRNLIDKIEGLAHQQQLQMLSLTENEISKIEGIENLHLLQTLNLSRNRIEIIEGLDHLKDLQSLYLSGNRISRITGLENLSSLRSLTLSNNKIVETSGLERLTSLQALFLSKNLISEVKGLNNLKNLKSLVLSENKIINISGLDILPALQTIELTNNEIISIEPLRDQTSLEKIGIAKNRIKDLSPIHPFLNKGYFEIVMRENLQLVKHEINVYQNLLESPPIEIIKQGTSVVINYFNELQKKGSEYLYEAKMLLVGQPRAGKTSLRYKLNDITSPLAEEDETTRGIDIDRLNFEITDNEDNRRQFYYNVWDFGGQQIYQTTHQFFLTHRSLYVLVLDTGNDNNGNDDSNINYWLQAVELLGGNSPLLLVKNEKNDRQINIDFAAKRQRFEFIKKEYSIELNALIPGTSTYSFKRVKEFRELKEDIEKELKRLPLVGFAMPINWVQIRNKLQELSKTNPFIRKQDYINLCKDLDVIEFERQMELSRIFHDLGIFLHFQEYGFLDDFIVLKNVWATDAVFAVLDNPQIKKLKGRFTDSDLPQIWEDKGYKKEVHKNLLALMMQFELCYQVEKTNPNVYIVPEMLSKEPPPEYKWQPNDDLPLFYRYDFMPRGLLTRLIVRLHKHIQVQEDEQIVWKTGVSIDGNTLDCPNSVAEITEAWDNKQLLIRVQGPFSKEFMSKITFQIDLLNDDFFNKMESNDLRQRSKWYKMIPCNCKSCKNSGEKHFYEYNELLERKEYGKGTIECKKRPFATVNIYELLDGVFQSQSDRKANANTPKKIFVSYSHHDEKWKNKLKKNLASLKSQNLIFEWDDQQIEAGYWDTQIEKAIEETDIFLFLITKNFLDSEYITNKEIIMAYDQFKSGKSKIFPIICEPCMWDLHPVTKLEQELHPRENKMMYLWLGKFQAFPKYGKPIQRWSPQQEGLLDVVSQLKKYL